MKIKVTQEDIDSGIKKSHEYCPLALALKRHFKKVRIENFEVTLDSKVLIMGQVLQHFTANFDNGEPVQPFSLYVDDLDLLGCPTSLGLSTR